MTTYHYKTSFSAAFQGAIDDLGIFRRTENCRSNRFSPLDYTLESTGPVNCPFAGCVFSTARGVEMSHHQETSAHPGWHRLGGRAAERSWLCSFQGCGSSFFKWDNLYHHMMLHSKPLSCPECPFRTAHGTRLRQHIEKRHPGCQSAPRRHFSKQLGSKFLKKPH